MKTICGIKVNLVNIGCSLCDQPATRTQDMSPRCDLHSQTVRGFSQTIMGHHQWKWISDPEVKTKGLWYYRWKNRKAIKRRLTRSACR